MIWESDGVFTLRQIAMAMAIADSNFLSLISLLPAQKALSLVGKNIKFIASKIKNLLSLALFRSIFRPTVFYIVVILNGFHSKLSKT